MAAHRYWRITIYRSYGTTGTAVEIQLRGTPGGADLSNSSGPVTGSSFQSPHAPERAFDDNNTTWWNFTTSTAYGAAIQWITYDFGVGNEQDIAEFTWNCGGSAGRNPRDANLEYSDDGVTWGLKAVFVDQPSVAADTDSVYTVTTPLEASEVVSKAGFHVVSFMWDNAKTSIMKGGYQVILDRPGINIDKAAYFAAIGPTDGAKVAGVLGYAVYEEEPRAKISAASGYVIYRPLPVPPRKTVVITTRGAGFGGSGIDNPLEGEIEQEQIFSASFPLPQNMQGSVDQDSTFFADLFVDNAAEDIFLIGAIEQDQDFSSVMYIPHTLTALIDQESEFAGDLFVEDSTENQFLEGLIEQNSAFMAQMTVSMLLSGDISQISTFAGQLEEGFSPASFANLIHWFDADDAASFSLSSTLVDQWDDKSGNAYHATAAGAARPTKTVSLVNGRPAVVMSGSNTLEAAWDTTVDDLTINVVFHGTQDVVTANWYSQPILYGREMPGAVNDFGLYTYDQFYGLVVRDNGIAAGTFNKINDGAVHVLTFVRQGNGSIRMYVDGEVDNTTTTNAATLNALTSILIGQNGWAGTIFEIFSYKASMTESDILLLHDYAMAKWGVGDVVLTGDISQSSDFDGAMTVSMHLEGLASQDSDVDGLITVGADVAEKRYWRLYITENNGSTVTIIGEAEFTEFDGGPDLTGAGTAFASTEFSADYVAANAFNNTFNTGADNPAGRFWSTANGSAVPSWLGYDFGEGNEVEVASVRILADRATDRPPRDFTVQSSADGVVWDDEWTVEEQIGWAIGEMREFRRPTPINAHLVGSIEQTSEFLAGTAEEPAVPASLSFWSMAHEAKNTNARPNSSRVFDRIGGGGYFGTNGSEDVYMGWTNNASAFKVPDGVTDEVLFGAHIVHRDTSTAQRPRIDVYDTANAAMFGFYVDANTETLAVYINGSLHNTYALTGMVDVNTWFWVSAHYKKSATEGFYKVQVNGTVVADVSLDTGALTNNIDHLLPYGFSTTGNIPHFRDLVITNGQGPAPFNDVLAPMIVTTLYPTSDVSNAWNLSTGSSAFALVDEATVNVTDYIWGNPDTVVELGFPTYSGNIARAVQAVATGFAGTGSSYLATIEINNGGADGVSKERSWTMTSVASGEWDVARYLEPDEWGSDLANIQVKLTAPSSPETLSSTITQVVVEVLSFVTDP